MDISLLSSIPTDSLYKFMSISGLMILVSSLVIPFYFKNNYQIKHYDLMKTHELSGLKVTILIERINTGLADSGEKCRDFHHEHRHLDSNDFFSQFHPWLMIQRNSPEMHDELSTFYSALGDDFEGIINEIRKEQIEIGCEFNKIGLLHEQLHALLFLQKLGVVIGSALTAFGFANWYSKLQVFIDASIAAAG